jgi:hypothetical protein
VRAACTSGVAPRPVAVRLGARAGRRLLGAAPELDSGKGHAQADAPGGGGARRRRAAGTCCGRGSPPEPGSGGRRARASASARSRPRRRPSSRTTTADGDDRQRRRPRASGAVSLLVAQHRTERHGHHGVDVGVGAHLRDGCDGEQATRTRVNATRVPKTTR